MRERYSSGSSWEEVFGFSRAVQVDDTLYISKTGALGPDGVIVASNVAGQTRVILEKISRILQDAGFALADVVQSRMYLTQLTEWRQAAEVHGAFFRDIRPAFTLLHVLPFPEPQMLVGIEVVAQRNR
ncbi:RidA family protein [Pseudomonas sp. C 49-2]|uniref:RidA family protein n=1 Tax=Pseudomonas TaxID=286 RepID=UPI000F8496DD|nr:MULTISPECIES: RidA family protein [Pseudomonas]MEB2647932.1 RidA family protein [Pseudomonas canadensis]RTX95699.1 RidA family protein [Pseudomonas sp. C 49-2]